jgi:xylose dehydrogenase (NAD/NADP)
MEKLRWGFIGAGGIAKRALYPALINSEFGEIYAVASRDADRAKALSPSGLTYVDYNHLLADPKVEAVYISLPNSLHLPWAIKAMRAGKHVLCEKPLGMNAAEVREAVAVSVETEKLFMEASWNRWHPRTQRLKEIVASGELGEITSIKTCFTYQGIDESDIRFVPELGGGMVYDLGPYSIVAPLWLTDFKEVSNITATPVWHHLGCDETAQVNFTIGGISAETKVSCNIPNTHFFVVEGSKGSMRTGGNDSFNSHNSASTLEIEVDGVSRIEDFVACDPYQLMADSFAKKVRGLDAWIMPLDESIKFAELFDSVFAVMGHPMDAK